MPKKSKAAPQWRKVTPAETEAYRKAIEKKLGVKRAVRVSKKAAPPSLLEASKRAHAYLETIPCEDRNAAEVMGDLRAAIDAHEADAEAKAYSAGHAVTLREMGALTPAEKKFKWTDHPGVVPCVFRFQGSERHVWCGCGKWEVMTGNFPERAKHKAHWQEHRDERVRSILHATPNCPKCVGNRPLDGFGCCEGCGYEAPGGGPDSI